MNRISKLTLLAAVAITLIIPAAGARSLTDIQTDSLLASHKVIDLDHGALSPANQQYADSVRGVIAAFYYDQFRHFSDPAAPYFLFMSRDASLAMGVGGCVRLRGYFDWDGAIPASGFAPYLIPMQPNPTRMRQLGTTPAGSTLFFRVLGRNKLLGNYQLYIEANFNGYGGSDMHLKKAYAIVNDFTIGYASSTFSDPAALPPTVDAQGPANKISPTRVLVRYMPVIKQRLTLAASLEMPSTQIDADGVSTLKITEAMPDVAAFVQWGWGQSEHVRLAAICRQLAYRDVLTSRNHYRVGWGVQLSSVAHPAAPLTTYLTASYGHGYGALSGDLLIGNYDMIATPSHSGELYAPASFGWCAGVQYNFRPNLFASVSVSQNRLLPKGGIAGSEYKYGMAGALNLFWNLTPRIQAGAEFDLALRRNFNGDHRTARRVGMMAQFSF